MWPNPEEPADLVTFTEEILNGKLHFLCSLPYLFIFHIIFTCPTSISFPVAFFVFHEEEKQIPGLRFIIKII